MTAVEVRVQQPALGSHAASPLADVLLYVHKNRRRSEPVWPSGKAVGW